MKSRALPLALVISGVLHAGVIALSHEAVPTLTSDPTLVYSTQLEAVLVDAVQDKGETLLPSAAAAESAASAHEADQIDELEHEVSRLEDLAASWQSKLEEIEAQRNAEKAGHHREMIALRESAQVRESDRQRLEVAVQTLTSELGHQQDANRRLQDQARESETSQLTLQVQKQRADAENERLVASLSETALALDALAQEKTGLERQLLDSKALSRELEGQLDDARAAVKVDHQEMTKERETLNLQMQAVSNELQNQQDTNRLLRDEADQINQALTALAREKDKTEAAHDDIATRLLEATSTLRQVSAKSDELQRMLSRSEEAAAELRHQLDDALANAQASTASLETGNALTELRPVPAAGNPKPVYPRLAIRRGIEGEVNLSVSVSSSGQVSGVRVSKPSGFAILDRAAVVSVRQWQFIPATRDGMPTAMVIDIPVQFRLIDTRS
tara:strand:+ start:28453 stop:29790 length:1338 start_codon:yes stop_codon:yes gene_type:complete